MIRIWGPSESTDPVRHGDMLKIAELEGLVAFLRANGITDADIMPPYRRGTYWPDYSDQYEVFVTQENVDAVRGHVEAIAVAQFLQDNLGLLGSLQLPFGSPSSYEDHRYENRLELLRSLS